MRLLLILLFIQGALAASRFHERNDSGLLFMYTFDEGQQSTTPPSKIRDISGRGLLGDLTSATNGDVNWDPARQGATFPSPYGGVRMVSERNTSDLLDAAGAVFTMEFWLRSPLNGKLCQLSSSAVYQEKWIAGFGDATAGGAFQPCGESSPSEGGWRLFSRCDDSVTNQVTLHFSFVHIHPFWMVPVCKFFWVPVVANAVSYIYIRSNGVAANGFSYGIAGASADGPLSATVWRRSDPKYLTVATSHNSGGWTGHVHMIAMHNRYLSNAEVNANYAIGPPNSFPRAATAALATSEDTAAALID
jgi:hypothetical protein